MIDHSKEIIKGKLILYAIALDDRSWNLLDDIFHEDAVATYGNKDIDFVIESKSRADILRMCKDSLGGCGTTQHFHGQPLDFFSKSSNFHSITSIDLDIHHTSHRTHLHLALGLHDKL